MSNGYKVLIGAEGAPDVSSWFKAGGELVQRGLDYRAQKEAESKAGKDTEAALTKVVTADRQATAANARALESGEAKSPSHDADAQALELASAAQDDAARGLSNDNQKKREQIAKDDLSKAVADWQKATSSKDAAATKAASYKVAAAKVTWGKAQNALMVAAAQPGAAGLETHSRSWFTRPVLGPLPGAVVLVGGAALGAGLLALVVKLVRR